MLVGFIFKVAGGWVAREPKFILLNQKEESIEPVYKGLISIFSVSGSKYSSYDCSMQSCGCVFVCGLYVTADRFAELGDAAES